MSTPPVPLPQVLAEHGEPDLTLTDADLSIRQSARGSGNLITPYYSDESVTLYCGDFRKLLPEVIEKHGVPALNLVDPPYGETSLSWDRWPDGWPALIPGRSMWCFGSMRMFLDRRDEFTGWKLSQDVVWEKHAGSGPALPDRFMRVHEHALHWYRGPWGDVYHDQQRVAREGPSKGSLRTHLSIGHRGDYAPRSWTDDGTRGLRSVLYARSMHQQGAINETEKPEGIVTPLLEYASPRGGLVLDVFAGGCTTLVAARNSGRRAIGIELREEQCALAVEHRLSQTVLPFGEEAS